VWQRFQSYTIGPADAALTFAQRLARENGWTEKFTERVLEEYKRFCFLAVTSTEQVTPSDQVDQAWHLHLTYTRDYWERFCPEVLGVPLHHGPTAGGVVERHRYFEQYARTLRSYEAVFGSAPSDIWPAAQRRLLEDAKARRVHPREGLIVPHWILWAAIPVLVGLAAVVVIFGD
jgi:hypothetical protein